MADKLIKVSDGQYVMASQVIRVERYEFSDNCTVVTSDGERLSLMPRYGERIYQAQERFINAVNEALAGNED
ncbi:hypothetical protein LL394_003027 [Serratia marcescens]|jgi:hypothetical protein|uniref:hypothetical protein n=1 Tax=Serratia marcescens TaxID=615 RepID=UPI0007456573|nr:hypothetical protein [Serratia marcescens]BEL74470.1 hypothetical protein SM12BL1_07730 [Serratia marcescens]BEN61928.1 hypothetical protein SMKC069_46190 [Serratia marcescens]CUZ16531.1 Uncharacterised protein [Serratia marcescens]